MIFSFGRCKNRPVRIYEEVPYLPGPNTVFDTEQIHEYQNRRLSRPGFYPSPREERESPRRMWEVDRTVFSGGRGRPDEKRWKTGSYKDLENRQGKNMRRHEWFFDPQHLHRLIKENMMVRQMEEVQRMMMGGRVTSFLAGHVAMFQVRMGMYDDGAVGKEVAMGKESLVEVRKQDHHSHQK